MALAELYLTDGTKLVNLLQGNQSGAGIGLQKVRFTRPQREADSIFANQYKTVTETYAITITGKTTDETIGQQRSLDGLLVQAENYFKGSAETGLVWLVSRAANETSPRYAIVFGGGVAEYDDLYGQPFNTATAATMRDLDLALERSAWLANPPTAPACKALTNAVAWQNYLSTFTNRAGVTNGRGLYTVKANGYMFAGHDGVILQSSNNGASFSTSKSLTAGNVAQQFIVAYGKLYAAVARSTANTNSGLWTATLTGGSWTQEVSSANAYSFAVLPDGRLLAGGDGLIRVTTGNGSWATYASGFTGAIKALTVTATGAVIAGDTYDLWRQPKGGAFSLLGQVISTGPYGYALSVGNRIFVVGDGAGINLSLDDGISFQTVLGTSARTVFYSATKGKYYAAFDAGLYSSVDGGITWAQDPATGGIVTPPFGEVTENNAGNIFYIDAGHIYEKNTATVLSGPQVVSCATPVYVANRSDPAMLQTIMVFDNSPSGYTVLGGNVDTVNSSPLFPSTMALADSLYLGFLDPQTNTPLPNAIYFNITKSNKTTGITWEYWRGFWDTIPQTVDTTQQLMRAGVLSFPPPNDWATVAVNGVTAYWIRARLSSIGSITTPPQANNIYAIARPYVEITGVKGDIPALAQLKITNANDGGSGDNWTQTNTLRVGLRSMDRGATFDPYMAPGFVSAIPGTDLGSGLGVQDPSKAGGGFYIHNTVNVGSYNHAAQYTPRGYLRDYYGTYRAYLRYAFYGTNQAVSLKLQLNNFTQGLANTGEEKILSTAVSTEGITRLLDMGQFTIGIQNFLDTDEIGNSFYFDLYSKATASSQTVDIFELILMPIDEWFGYFEDSTQAGPLTLNNTLDIDSASYHKRQLRSTVKYRGSELVTATWLPSANGPLFLQPGKTQRFYFLGEMYNGEYLASTFTQVHQVQLYAHERYLGGRGNG